MRKVKTSAILKLPLNKLFTVKNTYHDANQTDKARGQKLRREAAVIVELMLAAWTLGGDSSTWTLQILIFWIDLIRHEKYFPLLPEF